MQVNFLLSRVTQIYCIFYSTLLPTSLLWAAEKGSRHHPQLQHPTQLCSCRIHTEIRIKASGWGGRGNNTPQTKTQNCIKNTKKTFLQYYTHSRQKYHLNFCYLEPNTFLMPWLGRNESIMSFTEILSVILNKPDVISLITFTWSAGFSMII